MACYNRPILAKMNCNDISAFLPAFLEKYIMVDWTNNIYVSLHDISFCLTFKNVRSIPYIIKEEIILGKR